MTTGAIDAHGFAAHRPAGSVRRVAAPRNPACANARARVLPPVSRKACDGAGLERRSRESACAPPRDRRVIPGRSARAPRAPPAASSPASANAPALPPHAGMSRPARATRRRPPRAARKAIMESFPGGIFPYAARIARLAARRSVP
ncbi:hypothetical protein BURPS1710A_1011 [Burkholderia pseudomallei 1710a]|uniref:Uncharacterized protein n=1 Tax=Burkholderia pseudomallei 1710a TaxID=320371 RepID=A0A0E1W7M4_BURPE|nr:hypothetical protein BURPS1710A_1011 [Burkholderia pseudomallei 1710a]